MENNEPVKSPACKGEGTAGKVLGVVNLPCPYCLRSGYVIDQWEADRIKRILNIKDDSEQISLPL